MGSPSPDWGEMLRVKCQQLLRNMMCRYEAGICCSDGFPVFQLLQKKKKNSSAVGMRFCPMHTCTWACPISQPHFTSDPSGADHKCGKTVKENHECVPGVSLGSFISHNRAWISARVFLASSSSSHKVITSSLTPTPSFNEGMPSPLPRPWGELVLSTSMDWEKLSKLSSYSLGIE